MNQPRPKEYVPKLVWWLIILGFAVMVGQLGIAGYLALFWFY
jgi:hypothetical protein